MLKRMSTAYCASMMLLGSACSQDDNAPGQPSPEVPVAESLPRTLTPVATEGFEQPGDAVSGHDGARFYFTGVVTREEEKLPAVLTVPASGGEPETLAAGAPFGQLSGLVMGCNDAILYVADLGAVADPNTDPEVDSDTEPDLPPGALFRLEVSTGEVVRLGAREIESPTGIALSDDCESLYVTGTDSAGEPALFSLPRSGGPVRVILSGDPLIAPTGLHVDKDGVAWVMDHLAEGEQGAGVLFAIDNEGTATEVMSDLRMGTPGGVSLNSSGSTAFMPTIDEDGAGRLTSISLLTSEVVHIPAPDLTDPAGIRTARHASVFAVVDAENHTIYRAE